MLNRLVDSTSTLSWTKPKRDGTEMVERMIWCGIWWGKGLRRLTTLGLDGDGMVFDSVLGRRLGYF